MFPSFSPNARIWPRYELKCTFRKRNNPFPVSQCSTYESRQAFDPITKSVAGCIKVHLYIRLFRRIFSQPIVLLNWWLIADLADQLTERPLLQSNPAGWLAERTDGQTVKWMFDWMSKCPDMPTIWIEMHIWETWKSFFSNIAFHLQTTDKPPGQSVGGMTRNCFSCHCNQAGPEMPTLTTDWTDGQTDDRMNCRMCVCKNGKPVKPSGIPLPKQSAMWLRKSPNIWKLIQMFNWIAEHLTIWLFAWLWNQTDPYLHISEQASPKI